MELWSPVFFWADGFRNPFLFGSNVFDVLIPPLMTRRHLVPDYEPSWKQKRGVKKNQSHFRAKVFSDVSVLLLR